MIYGKSCIVALRTSSRTTACIFGVFWIALSLALTSFANLFPRPFFCLAYHEIASSSSASASGRKASRSFIPRVPPVVCPSFSQHRTRGGRWTDRLYILRLVPEPWPPSQMSDRFSKNPIHRFLIQTESRERGAIGPRWKGRGRHQE